MSDIVSTLVTRRTEAARAPWHGWLLPACVGIHLAFLFYATRVLGFQVLQADALSYWRESLEWWKPFSAWWVPGYPLTLALVNLLTGHQVSPAALSVATAAAFYLVGVAATRALAVAFGLTPRAAASAALVFAVYPFVGLTYTVYPIADAMAIALVLLMWLAFARQRWGLWCLAVAACLLTHKATWFFVMPLVAYAWWWHRDARRWCALAFVPLLGLVIAGAVYHGDPLWMVRWGVGTLVKPRGGLPLLDGTLGLFLTGQPSKVLKGVVVCLVLLMALAIGIESWRRRFAPGILMALPILAMGLIINQYEVWAVVRFSKALVVPAAVCLMPYLARVSPRTARAVVTALVVTGIATNAAYAFYMVRFFDAGR
jgi:hypothetical protein